MQDSRTYDGPSPLVALGVCAVAGVLFVLPATMAEAVRSTFRDAALPGTVAVHSVTGTVASVRDVLFDRTALEQRVADLETALVVSERRRRALAVAAATNHDADRLPLVSADLLPARVLGTEAAEAWRAGRLLDVGRDEGIREAADVLASDGPIVDRGRDGDVDVGHPVLANDPRAGRILVGRIRAVGRWTSVVQPITDDAFRVRVRLAQRTESGLAFGATGLLRGTGDEHCRLDFIGSTEAVAEGDEIFASSPLLPGTDEDDAEPPLLYVGRVVRAELPRGAPHWEIDVEPEATASAGDVLVLRRRLNPQRPGIVEEP